MVLHRFCYTVKHRIDAVEQLVSCGVTPGSGCDSGYDATVPEIQCIKAFHEIQAGLDSNCIVLHRSM